MTERIEVNSLSLHRTKSRCPRMRRDNNSSADKKEDHHQKPEWNKADNTTIFIPVAEKAYRKAGNLLPG